MYQHDTIALDHEYVISTFSVEELRAGLECSLRVKRHLERHVRIDSKVRYMNNLDVLNQIIYQYEEALTKYKLAQ